jgi:hypothetical protein
MLFAVKNVSVKNARKMVYSTQNHWVSGLRTYTREHNVSENGSVSVLR